MPTIKKSCVTDKTIHSVEYDEEDEDLILSSRLYYNSGQKYYYLQQKGVGIHRIILSKMDPDFDISNKKTFVDHINNNPLDNRRENLRKATPRQNSINHKKFSNNVSGFNGIHSMKNPGGFVWKATVGNVAKDGEKATFKSLHDAIRWQHKTALEKQDGDFINDKRTLQEKLDSVEDHTYPDERESMKTCPNCMKTMTKQGFGKHELTCKLETLTCDCGRQFERGYSRSAKALLKRHQIGNGKETGGCSVFKKTKR